MSHTYALQVLDILDKISILDIDDIKYSISYAYALQVLDMIDMKLILDMDDIKYSMSCT